MRKGFDFSNALLHRSSDLQCGSLWHITTETGKRHRDPGSPLTKVRSTRVAERQGVHHLPKCHNHRPDCVSWGSRVDLGQPVIHLRRERHYPPGPLKASVFQRPWIRVSRQSPPPSSP
jgi:hypothetical protein